MGFENLNKSWKYS